MKRVELVGILNMTPDSFSDGGLYENKDAAMSHANGMFNEGANYVDIGAESSRPGAIPMSHEQEWSRLQPVLTDLIFAYPDQISLDTYHPETVRETLRRAGPIIVNDVTTFNNPAMIEVAAEFDLRCIVSHLPPQHGQNIQGAHDSDNKIDSVNQVRDELLSKRETMIQTGINASKIILDPGIGFGKNTDINWQLLEFAAQVPEIDVMIGYSRKRFLGRARMDLKQNLLAGEIAVAAGAKYLRVHDVAGHRRLLN